MLLVFKSARHSLCYSFLRGQRLTKLCKRYFKRCLLIYTLDILLDTVASYTCLMFSNKCFRSCASSKGIWLTRRCRYHECYVCTLILVTTYVYTVIPHLVWCPCTLSKIGRSSSSRIMIIHVRVYIPSSIHNRIYLRFKITLKALSYDDLSKKLNHINILRRTLSWQSQKQSEVFFYIACWKLYQSQTYFKEVENVVNCLTYDGFVILQQEL